MPANAGNYLPETVATRLHTGRRGAVSNALRAVYRSNNVHHFYLHGFTPRVNLFTVVQRRRSCLFQPSDTTTISGRVHITGHASAEVRRARCIVPVVPRPISAAGIGSGGAADPRRDCHHRPCPLPVGEFQHVK